MSSREVSLCDDDLSLLCWFRKHDRIEAECTTTTSDSLGAGGEEEAPGSPFPEEEEDESLSLLAREGILDTSCAEFRSKEPPKGILKKEKKPPKRIAPPKKPPKGPSLSFRVVDFDQVTVYTCPCIALPSSLKMDWTYVAKETMSVEDMDLIREKAEAAGKRRGIYGDADKLTMEGMAELLGYIGENGGKRIKKIKNIDQKLKPWKNALGEQKKIERTARREVAKERKEQRRKEAKERSDAIKSSIESCALQHARDKGTGQSFIPAGSGTCREEPPRQGSQVASPTDTEGGTASTASTLTNNSSVEETRTCCVCKVDFPFNYYSKRQQRKEKPKCRVCAQNSVEQNIEDKRNKRKAHLLAKTTRKKAKPSSDNPSASSS